MADTPHPSLLGTTDAFPRVLASLDTLQHVVETHSNGVSEHTLFKLLADAGAMPEFSADTEPLTLFRVHFQLFHQLYRLRERLLESQAAILLISPIKIRLIPYSSGHPALSLHDPLYSYYMNLENLHNMDTRQLDHMVGEFWARLAGGDERKRALAELGLVDPVNDDTIRKAYRKLAMTLHPDRGGEKIAFQAINEAMLQLKKG